MTLANGIAVCARAIKPQVFPFPTLIFFATAPKVMCTPYSPHNRKKRGEEDNERESR